MKDILFLVGVFILVYIFYRVILKEPILPWKEKKDAPTPNLNQPKRKSGKKKGGSNISEEEAMPFQELFPSIHSFDNHMIRHKDNMFSMVAEVEPVNYFLLDHTEQEGIDAIFETWLAQLNYSVRIYLQNRYVDLTDPINDIKTVMEDQDDLPPIAYEYGQKMIDDLLYWQHSQPRFETKRFLIFDYKVDAKDIKAEDSEELEEKIVDKAFNELHRRLMTAKSQLRKADIQVNLLTSDGIGEVLFYTFNRRKALKNRYRSIEEQEQLALYVTADQTANHIARVKGEMDLVKEETKAEEQAS